MKRLLSALAAAGVLVVTTGSAALAAPTGNAALDTPAGNGGQLRPAPVAQGWATNALSAQPGQQSQVWLRLDLQEMVPRVITADGPDSITISGNVVNVGDRPIEHIELRLERGAPLTDEDDVRRALREPANAEVVQPNFTTVADRLEQNESKPFRLTVPLRGTDPTALRITEPGIYPILANINGVPDFGGRARLAALSTLLPVLAVPGGPARVKPTNPAKITLLWPLADRPRLVSTGPTVLTDDELAGSVAMGGRLHGLLQTYESTLQGPLATGVCLAVDPDLLRTVAAMSEGYEVRGEGPGRGRSAAELWLAKLRLLAAGRCVIALPDSGADLVALSRAKLTELGALALEGDEVVRRLLGVPPTPGLTWPEDGVVDQQTLADLTAQGVTSLVLDQSAVEDPPGTGPVRVNAVADGKGTTAVRLDGMVSDALNGAAASRPVAGVTTPTETRPVSVQNALAALTFRAGFQSTGQHVVVAPPRRWNAPAGEVDTLLRTTESLVGGGFANAVSLASLLAVTPPQTAELTYPVEAGAREVPPSVAASVAESWRQLQQMSEAMSQEDAESTEPADLVDPLRLGLLRAVSGAWRGDEDGARAALALGREGIGGLQSQVTVTEPNSPILLGSGDSPIPLSIKNRLDVRVTVRIVIEDTPGIVAKELPDTVLPAHGVLLVPVPVEVLRSGRFPVHVRLVTPNGVELGERARLEVSSSVYGTITVVITCLAGAALVLLSARRIYRRVRAARVTGVQVPNDASGVTPPERSSTS